MSLVGPGEVFGVSSLLPDADRGAVFGLRRVYRLHRRHRAAERCSWKPRSASSANS